MTNVKPNKNHLMYFGVKPGLTQTRTTTWNAALDVVGQIFKDHKDIKILDVGAGRGHSSLEFKKAGYINTFTVEPDAKGWNPDYSSIKQVKDRSVDFVFCSYVLNVVTEDIRKDILKDILRVLKDKGTALVIVRGYDDLKKTKPVIDYGKEGMVLKKNGHHTFQKGFDFEELKEFLTSNAPHYVRVWPSKHATSKSIHAILYNY